MWKFHHHLSEPLFALLSLLLNTATVEAQELTVQTMDMVRRRYLWLEDLKRRRR